MIAFFIAVFIKGSILMAAAAVAVAVMSRVSAATRHFIWTLTIVGLLALPVIATMLPAWQLAVPIASSETDAAIDVTEPAHVAPATAATINTRAAVPRVDEDANARLDARLPWPLLLGAIYAVGALLLFARLLHQWSAARRIVHETRAISDRDWIRALDDCAARMSVRRSVALRRSGIHLMPMTQGTTAPSIVIPADADAWDEDRRRAVLLHELAHVARHDCLTQMLSAIACAAYWFHPAVWYVARRLRIERELACDDRVLAAGAKPDEYAGHLLELAYSWSGRHAPTLAVGMASFDKLEGRMRAVLDPARNRSAPSRRMWVIGAALGAGLLLPLAAMTITTASAHVRSTLMGPGDGPQSEARGASANAAEQPVGSQENVAGRWELRPSRSRDSVLLRIAAGRLSWNGELPASNVERLLSRQVRDANGPVRVSISRDAGSLEIDGTIKDGTGSGTFRFVPSETFIAGLTRRGFSRPATQQLFALAQNEIGFEFIDELAAQKYERPDIENLVRAAHHGVGTDFLREMGRAGYRVGTLDALIRFRDHGVDPEFVRGLRALGVSDLSPDDLVRFRDHGVDPDYVSGMQQAGYRAAALDLVSARDHGVDPDYLAVLRNLGYSSVTLDEAIRARDHGLDRDYLRDMREVGYTLTLADLIRARDHGVTPDYIFAMGALGYKEVPVESLIRMRDHGVTPEYVLEVQKRGATNPSIDELIRLRDRPDSPYERKLGQWNYHVDRLLAEIERALDRLLQ
jgi:beta-lactamase regulating signal transducer with metallopeptidase domain